MPRPVAGIGSCNDRSDDDDRDEDDRGRINYRGMHSDVERARWPSRELLLNQSGVFSVIQDIDDKKHVINAYAPKY